MSAGVHWLEEHELAGLNERVANETHGSSQGYTTPLLRARAPRR
jgi:hypothetical protein